MCNGNKYCNPPLFAKNIARILIPLTTPYFKATSFFGEYLSGIDNRQARPYGVLVRRFADDGSSGGLKGKTAPGDAHPYLALFYLGLILSEMIAGWLDRAINEGFDYICDSGECP